MKFTVEIPDDIVQWANAEAVNRQTIAKFMREELEMVGSRHGHSPELGRGKFPGEDHEWRAWIFNVIKVRCQRSGSARSARDRLTSRRREA